jgi:hypothetical protein
MLATFIVGGCALLFLGDWALDLIKSKTPLLSKSFVAVALLVVLLDNNRGVAEWMFSTKNEIPFFKASLFTGVIAVVLLLV